MEGIWLRLGLVLVLVLVNAWFAGSEVSNSRFVASARELHASPRSCHTLLYARASSAGPYSVTVIPCMGSGSRLPARTFP